jgi:hypothetical protein
VVSEASNDWIWILIVLVVLFIIFLLIGMFVMNKRNNKAPIILDHDGQSNQVVTYKGSMAPQMVDINVTDELLPHHKPPPVEEPSADISEFIRKPKTPPTTIQALPHTTLS